MRRFSGYLFVLPYLILFSLFLVAPLLYGLRLSFQQWELASPAPPRFVGFKNFDDALHDPFFWKALGTTFKLMLFISPLTIGLALLIAAGIRAAPNQRQSFYRAAFFLPGMLTISVVGILWRWFYNPEFGLMNGALAPFHLKPPWLDEPNWAAFSITLMTLWWTVGGAMVILLAALEGVPEPLYEAAALDGARTAQRFWYITLPQIRPVLLFASVLNIIGAFQIFGQTFIVTRGGPEFSTRTLVQYIYDTAFNNYRMGYASAMSWLLFLVISGFALVQFRLLRER